MDGFLPTVINSREQKIKWLKYKNSREYWKLRSCRATKKLVKQFIWENGYRFAQQHQCNRESKTNRLLAQAIKTEKQNANN